MAEYSLGTAHGTVRIDSDTSGADQANRSLQNVDENAKKTGRSVDDLGKKSRVTAGSMNIVSATLTVMTTKMAVVAAGGLALAAIAVQASGAIGLLPAAGIAGGLALGSLAVGMQGFGDAMKNAGDPEAFAESLKELAPEARNTAKALRSLRDDWKELQRSVQDRLFQGVGGEIQELASGYLPMLRSALTETAGHFNTAFKTIADQLQTTERQADMKAIFEGNSAVVGNLVRAFPPLISVFIDLAAVATPILERITSGLGEGAAKFAEFIANARQTGQLASWIETGLQALQDLWTIISLLTGTVWNLIQAFGGPGSVLEVLIAVATALNVVSGFIRDNIAWIGPLITALGAVALAYKLWTAASALWATLTATHAAIVQSTMLRTIATATMATLRWIGNFVLMSAAAIAWVAVQIVQFAIASAQWVAMAAVATGRAIVVAAAWLLTAGANAAVAVARTIAAAAVIVAQWVLMGAQAMARAVVIAAAWFIALGPIGWAIAALIAVAVFVVIFWDDIVAYFKAGAEAVANWMRAAWSWIVQRWNEITAAFRAAGSAIGAAVQAAVSWLISVWNSGLNFLRAIPGIVMGVFAAAGSWLIGAGRNILAGLVSGITGMFGGVYGALRGIWSAVTGFFGGAGSWLVGAGSNLIRGLYNGIIAMGGWVYNAVMGWARSLLNGIKGFFGIRSPSRVFANLGRDLMLGMGEGIDAAAGAAEKAATSAARGLTDATLAALQGQGPTLGATVGAGGATGITRSLATDPSRTSAAAGAIGGPSKLVNIEMNTYNPVAEKASDNEARRLRAAAAVGSF